MALIISTSCIYSASRDSWKISNLESVVLSQLRFTHLTGLQAICSSLHNFLSCKLTNSLTHNIFILYQSKQHTLTWSKKFWKTDITLQFILDHAIEFKQQTAQKEFRESIKPKLEILPTKHHSIKLKNYQNVYHTSTTIRIIKLTKC